jgi:hypothetical protein
MLLFENRVLRRIFVPGRDETTGDRREVHKSQLHNMCFSPYVIRMIKSRLFAITFHSERVNSCEISSSHGGEYDVQSCLLGCTAV